MTETKVEKVFHTNTRAKISVPVGISQAILLHKNHLALCFWFDLKTLYVSGRIFADAGRYPYRNIGEQLLVSHKTVSKYISILSKMKLIKIYADRSMQLVSKTKLIQIILKDKYASRRKNKFVDQQPDAKYFKGELRNSRSEFTNTTDRNISKHLCTARQAIQGLAIEENLGRQRHTILNKIFENLVLQHVAQRQNIYVASLAVNEPRAIGCTLAKPDVLAKATHQLSAEQEASLMGKNERRKILQGLKNEFLKARGVYEWKKLSGPKKKEWSEFYFQHLLAGAENVYRIAFQQIALGRPKINPTITLSCSGISRTLNGSGAPSSGFYQSFRLGVAGLLQSHRRTQEVKASSPAVAEAMIHAPKNWRSDAVRSDVFECKQGNRPSRFYLSLPNQLELTLSPMKIS